MLSCQSFQVSQEFMKLINNPCSILCPHKMTNGAINIFMLMWTLYVQYISTSIIFVHGKPHPCSKAKQALQL